MRIKEENNLKIEETKAAEISKSEEEIKSMRINKIEERMIEDESKAKEVIDKIKEQSNLNNEKIKGIKSNRVEEKIIGKEIEVKESIDKIKKGNNSNDEKLTNKFNKIDERATNQSLEAKKEIEKIKQKHGEKEENKTTKFHKIQEKNIYNHRVAEEKIKQIKSNLDKDIEFKNKRYLCQHITNDIKLVLDAQESENEKDIEPNDIQNHSGKVQSFKVKVSAKIAEVEIKEALYGRVRFSKPILGIIDVKNLVMIRKMDLIKNLAQGEEENAILMYEGVVRVAIEYLEDVRICSKNIDAVSKYYLTYIPFQGVKKVKIDDEDFKKEEVLNNKIYFDMKSSEFAIDTTLSEEKSRGQYINVYGQCEAFIILECMINIFMKKIL